VVPLTEWLPVRLVPEQGVIAAVRLDVIDVCSRFDHVLSLAEYTERMLLQEEEPHLLPAPAVVQPSGA
jgi:hypothetical protein